MGELVGTIDMNLFSVLILCYLLSRALKRMDKEQMQNKIFTTMLIFTIAMLLFDATAMVVDGKAGNAARLLNVTLNLAIYMFAPLLPLLWLLYTDLQIYQDENRARRLIKLVVLFSVIYLFIALVFTYNSWFFYIDGNNVYHRGSLFFIHVIVMYGLLSIIVLFLLKNRDALPRSHLLTMLFFAVPPLIGGILQTLFYGILCVWPSITLSEMLIYINIQDQNLSIDYLTGAHNRRQLDYYLNNRVQTAVKPFSAMMIDVNNFKAINDTLGHQVGDHALISAVEVLKSSLRKTDVIARYGGDEFLVVSDVDSKQGIQAIAERIRAQCGRSNAASEKPYELNFSIGCAVYLPESGLSAEQFLKLLDTYMYEDKKRQQN